MKKCIDCVGQSQVDIYKQPNHSENDDPNYLHFDHFNEEIHGIIRRSWVQQKVSILIKHKKHCVLLFYFVFKLFLFSVNLL